MGGTHAPSEDQIKGLDHDDGGGGGSGGSPRSLSPYRQLDWWDVGNHNELLNHMYHYRNEHNFPQWLKQERSSFSSSADRMLASIYLPIMLPRCTTYLPWK